MTAAERIRGLVERTLEQLGGFLAPSTLGPRDFAVEAADYRSSLHNWAIVSFDGRQHPLIDGILYCRRGITHERCLEFLRSGDRVAALMLLLNDRDEYDRQPPASEEDLRKLIEAVDCGTLPPMHRAMLDLKYGPVADYFAIRPATPTFLSGLGLLALTAKGCGRVTEVGCGLGHFLWWLRRCGIAGCGGIDVVFSKLWLARQYLVGDVPLAAIDVVDAAARDASDVEPSLVQEASESLRHLVFCHDVFYFLKHKVEVLRYFHRAARPVPRIAIGHTHQRGVDPNSSGEPLAVDAYLEAFRSAVGSDPAAFDDADLLALTLGRCDRPSTRAIDESGETPALSFVWPSGDLTVNEDLHRIDSLWRVVPNPQLHRDATSGRWAYRWPDPRFEAEYREADYLHIDQETSALLDRIARQLPCQAGYLVAKAPAASDLLTRRLLLPTELACEMTPYTLLPPLAPASGERGRG